MDRVSENQITHRCAATQKTSQNSQNRANDHLSTFPPTLKRCPGNQCNIDPDELGIADQQENGQDSFGYDLAGEFQVLAKGNRTFDVGVDIQVIHQSCEDKNRSWLIERYRSGICGDRPRPLRKDLSIFTVH